MSMDDFYAEIDQTEKAKKDSKRATEENNASYVRALLSEVTPLVADHKKKLEDRGVSVEFEHEDCRMKFIMYFSDGGHQGFVVTKDSNDGRYKIVSHHTNDDGRNFTGEDGDAFRVGTDWTADDFKAYLEKQIKDFFFYADRHGGYRS